MREREAGGKTKRNSKCFNRQINTLIEREREREKERKRERKRKKRNRK